MSVHPPLPSAAQRSNPKQHASSQQYYHSPGPLQRPEQSFGHCFRSQPVLSLGMCLLDLTSLRETQAHNVPRGVSVRRQASSLRLFVALQSSCSVLLFPDTGPGGMTYRCRLERADAEASYVPCFCCRPLHSSPMLSEVSNNMSAVRAQRTGGVSPPRFTLVDSKGTGSTLGQNLGIQRRIYPISATRDVLPQMFTGTSIISWTGRCSSFPSHDDGQSSLSLLPSTVS